MVELAILLPSRNNFFLRFELKNRYAFLTKEEHIAAVLSTHQDDFGFSGEGVGHFICLRNDTAFSIYDRNKWDSRRGEKYVLGTSLDPKVATYEDVILLLVLLRKYTIIHTV